MKFVTVEKDEQIKCIEELAKIIWNEHYIGNLEQEQIEYMLNKFQSFVPIKDSINNNYIYYLFCEEETPFGYMAFQPKEGRLFLSKLYILKEYRGKGYAKKAFEFMQSYCIENGLKAIWLTCNKHNSSSLKIYEKLGFKVIDETVADIGNGYVMDDYILEKNI